MRARTPDDFDLIDDGQDFGPRCIECGEARSALVGGAAIYPHRPDLYNKNFWQCGCGAYCGCHPGTQNPLGFPAGPETRRARSRLHAVLDPLWKGQRKQKKRRRSKVYAFISAALGIPRDKTHSAMFDAETCERAIQALARFDPNWNPGDPVP